MKVLIQQTDPDRKTTFVEKVSTCHPDGNLSMTSDVFDEATCEQQWEVDHMEEGREKMEACLRFANDCVECGAYDKALGYYSSVLENTVEEGRIVQDYHHLAERAYQGVIRCNSCDDEYTWEVSSEILAKYEHLFIEKQDGNE